MKEITNYKEFNEEENAPLLVDNTGISYADKKGIIGYLNKFDVDCVSAGKVYDFVKKEYTDIDLVTYTDGEYYWSASEIYHFDKHDIKLDIKFVNKVIKCML